MGIGGWLNSDYKANLSPADLANADCCLTGLSFAIGQIKPIRIGSERFKLLILFTRVTERYADKTGQFILLCQV